MAEDVALKRSLSLAQITYYGLGTILGAGIYVLVGKVAGNAGIYAPVAFLVAGLIAAFTAFSYAELSARYPFCAGEAVYVQQGLGLRPLSILVGGLIVLTGVVSCATLVSGFVGYLHVFLPLPHWLAVTLLIFGLWALASWGIVESVRAAVVVTLIEVGGLLLIIAVSGRHLQELPQRLPELLPPFDLGVWHGILLGAFLAFYAFIGFEDMVNVAEEVKEPQRNLPRAILLALGLATLLYLLVALAAVLTLPVGELAGTRAPLAEMYRRATGQEPVLIGLISLFAVTNGALIQIVMGSRVLYGMSRQGWLPRPLGYVSPRTRTPLIATAAMALAVQGLALGVELVALAKATSFIILIVFALINLSLVRVKRRQPVVEGVRSYPLWVPAAGFLSCTALVAFQLNTWLN
ncbi:MAG: amino acid permease [Hydrogenophilaceae bacterium]|nr:amino acid permease [Hydrogenophilaceae bacterium]